jgi:hypothetical protein
MTGRADACRLRTGDGVYVAVTPCERFAKIGYASQPVLRVHESYDALRPFERENGLGRSVPVRVYDGGFDFERRCHDFLAPDRVKGEIYRVGPRLRILIARLDRGVTP